MNQLRLCQLHTLDLGECHSISSEHGDFFAVRTAQGIFCYRNVCPHLGTTLEFAPNQFLTHDKSLIQCSLHGALFEIESGECLSGPCSDQSLQAISHTIINDWIVLKV